MSVNANLGKDFRKERCDSNSWNSCARTAFPRLGTSLATHSGQFLAPIFWAEYLLLNEALYG